MATEILTNRVWLKRLSLSALCVLLAAISLWLFRYFYYQQVPSTPTPIPSSIATGVNVNELNAKGQLLHHMLSDKVYNYAQQARSTFIKPVGYYYQPQQPVWIMRANSAVLLNNDQILHFHGDVQLHQAAGQNNAAITLDTQAMTVLPQQKIAYNNIATTITQSGLNVSTTGFHANLQTNVVKLLSQTKARYTNSKKAN